MILLQCPKCDSEIAINDNEIRTFDIDCDCGAVITPKGYKGICRYAGMAWLSKDIEKTEVTP
jgi:hypothetical protein